MTAARPTPPPVRRPSLARDVTATLALAAYSFVVAIGFARVFSGWEFVPDLALLIVIGHGSSFVLRRARVSGWVSIPVSTILMLWALAIYQYGSTMSWLVPGRRTWHQVRLDVGLVRDQFQTAVAPVIYEVGWATLAGLAMVVVVAMADSFAFRAEARGEALVPGGVLFVFIAALGRERMRVESAVLLIAAGVVAVVALRALHDRRRRVELTTARGSRSLTMPATIATAAAIALLAGVIGPRIPGAEAEPLYRTRGRGGGITEISSPLVDIRSRLINLGNAEMFRVNADAEAYWRLTTLPEFDGRTFSLPNRPLTRIDADEAPTGGGTRIRQQIQIVELDSKLLPAAADPVAVDPNAEIRLNSDTGTLLKTSDLERGELFTVVSNAPETSLTALRAASTQNPPDEVFLGLPDDLPDVVAELAAEVTAGAGTDLDRMVALENWFQTFRYSTEVQAGHSSSAIESFLQIRVGYCEQFAATFAAMARTLDVPSRVAVGFTWGQLRDDGWYSVRGKNMHAWPEIWFDGIGWVAFEPTPGRGIPGAQHYTGIEPQQDTSPVTASDGPIREAEPLPPTPTTVFAPAATLPPQPRAPDPDATGAAPAAPRETDLVASDDTSLPWPVIVFVIAVLAALAFPAVARRWRIHTRRHHGTPQRVVAAWQRACRSALQAGVKGRPSMTSSEWAAATAHELPVAARPMASLAAVVDRIEFSRPGSLGHNGVAAALGRDCELWSDQVGRIAGDTLTTRDRVRRYFTDWR